MHPHCKLFGCPTNPHCGRTCLASIGNPDALAKLAKRRRSIHVDPGPSYSKTWGEAPTFVRLGDLRPGAVFATRSGIRAVKSEYRYPNGDCQCVLLRSGEYAHFPEGDDTHVREIALDQIP